VRSRRKIYKQVHAVSPDQYNDVRLTHRPVVPGGLRKYTSQPSSSKRRKQAALVSSMGPLELRALPSTPSTSCPSSGRSSWTTAEPPSSRDSRRSLPVEVLGAVPEYRARRAPREAAGVLQGGHASVGSVRRIRDAAPGGPRHGAGAELEDAPSGVPPIGRLSASGRWGDICEQLSAGINSEFVSGGLGAGKSTLLRKLGSFLSERYTADGDVVVLAPTGTSTKTTGCMTYHSFFGFGREYMPHRLDSKDEAERLLATGRYGSIKNWLRKVQALLLNEISIVSAANLRVMFEFLARVQSDAMPGLWFSFGYFLQLRPVEGEMAYTAPC